MKKGRAPIMACGLFLCLPLLVSCGGESNVPTAEQNRQLTDADRLLNSAPDSLSNVDDNAFGVSPSQSENDVSNAG